MLLHVAAASHFLGPQPLNVYTYSLCFTYIRTYMHTCPVDTCTQHYTHVVSMLGTHVVRVGLAWSVELLHSEKLFQQLSYL